MKYQEILIIVTEESGIKSEAYGWSQYDSSRMSNDPIIGLAGGHPGIGRSESPDCVLRAMSCGWFLMGPPQPFQTNVCKDDDFVRPVTHYEWWLSREITPDRKS